MIFTTEIIAIFPVLDDKVQLTEVTTIVMDTKTEISHNNNSKACRDGKISTPILTMGRVCNYFKFWQC